MGGLSCDFFSTYENNYLITIGIFLPVLLTSCRSDQTIPTVIQETTTRPVVTEVLSDIIDTCKFIPLETASDKSLVGHISKILKYKDKFYIATDNKRILVFNTDGSFSHRIDRLGTRTAGICGFGRFRYRRRPDHRTLPSQDRRLYIGRRPCKQHAIRFQRVKHKGRRRQLPVTLQQGVLFTDHRHPFRQDWLPASRHASRTCVSGVKIAFSLSIGVF